MNISAGIVLYNPDINRLKENIEAVIMQCSHVYLVDNGSDNLNEVKKIIKRFNCKQLSITENESNMGIAKALNQMCSAALDDGFDWILTLDQDSVCPSNMIEEYRKALSDKNTAMLCPLIYDRNRENKITKQDDVIEVDECITSGSLLRLLAWKEISGFDEIMFIDSVDFDICHRLKRVGYKILCVQSVVLIHELGHIQIRRFLLRKVNIMNHSPFRKYYIARNTVYLARKERRSVLIALLKNIKLFLITWLYEKEKITKTQKIFKGTIDGLRITIT